MVLGMIVLFVPLHYEILEWKKKEGVTLFGCNELVIEDGERLSEK